jgi:hypothetical protein
MVLAKKYGKRIKNGGKESKEALVKARLSDDAPRLYFLFDIR